MQIFYQKNSSNPLFGHPTLLIGLRIDAGGMLEVTAEIGCGGETELIRGFLYCLFARIALESMILAGSTTPSPTPTPAAQMNVSGEGDPIEGR